MNEQMKIEQMNFKTDNKQVVGRERTKMREKRILE